MCRQTDRLAAWKTLRDGVKSVALVEARDRARLLTMSHHEDEAQARDAPKGTRGARGGKVSARAVVRLAQRVLHKDKWQSFEISQSSAGVSIRVHRVAHDTSTASSEPPAAQRAAKKTEKEKGPAQKLSRKRIKSIKRQRHGMLSRLSITGKITRWRLVAPFFAWYSRTITLRSSLPPAGHGGGDVEMEEGGKSVPPGSEGPPRPEGGPSPVRSPAHKKARTPVEELRKVVPFQFK